MAPASAGIHPATSLPSDTIRAMFEKNLSLDKHFPKHVQHLARTPFDLVINMSGHPLTEMVVAPVRDWQVPDPVSMKYEDHRAVRDQIELLVMNLILELRRAKKSTPTSVHRSLRPKT
jgi:protein-tyrosine-phosphatase